MSLSGKTDDYAMPEDYITEKGKIGKEKKELVLYQRYGEGRDQNKFVTDQDQWKQNQIVKSQLKVEIQDRFQQEEKYYYVFDP